MLNPDYFVGADKQIQKYLEQLEEDVLRDVANHLKTATARNQMEALIDLDYSLDEMSKKVAKFSDKSVSEVEKIMSAAGIKSYAEDKSLYSKGKKHLPDYQDNLSAMKFVEAIKRQSGTDLKNITRTTGLAGKGLKEFYKTELSQAVLNLRSGAFSSDQIIRQTINKCADRGLTSINYASGRTIRIESAVRMCVNTGFRQLTTQMGLMNAELVRQDLMEISAHAGARPTHQEWQGKVVSLSGKQGYLSLSDIEYGAADGFSGINCRHSWYPFFEGISEPAYSDFEEPQPFEYKGKIYTAYEAAQRIRHLENSIKKEKRKITMYDELGNDESVTTHKVREQRLCQERDKFRNHAKVYRTKKDGYNKNDKNISGAISDEHSQEARKHAKLYYNEIRSQTTDVARIAANTGYEESIIKEIKEYLFIDKHHLIDGYRRFDPDFAIAQSWQRLAQNDIKKHDLTLLKHEVHERRLIARGMTQDEAHKETSKLYNYKKEVGEYYAKLKKRKKRK